MKVRFDKPTEAFSFLANVKVQTATGWKTVMAYPTDGRPKGPALFATHDAMIEGVKKLVRRAR